MKMLWLLLISAMSCNRDSLWKSVVKGNSESRPIDYGLIDDISQGNVYITRSRDKTTLQTCCDENGLTLLMIAAGNGHDKCARMLIEEKGLRVEDESIQG